MSTTQRALDTQELEQRVKDMYREVAEEPFNEFHFETGRQLADPIAREPVVDPRALPTRAHQAGAQEQLQVVGGVGEALLDLGRDLLDRALPLGEHVDDLGPPPAAKRLGYRRERIEEGGLGSSTHTFKLSLEYLSSKE